ncbi:MAG: hypothetical protein JXB50_07325 [Spirochaetes bacterium]|nr:hypothetical protein [Spirochaetota bacterium]
MYKKIFMDKILKEIVDKRVITIKNKGINFGYKLPAQRQVPITLPDMKKGITVCEIKRGSPSEGKMNDILNPVEWADKYIKSGADAISILTEENYFFGSLDDLINIKNKFPNVPVLRKDFLINEEEVEISYLAGADMILLIASVLIDIDKNRSTDLINKMKIKAEKLGMMPLIEVHNLEELNAVLTINPKVIGINSRDLKTFLIKRGYPFALKKNIDDSIYTIYESGIRNCTDSFFIGSSGFNGLLIGSSIIKSSNINEKISDIKKGFSCGILNRNRFYNELFYKIHIEKKLVVKICGITNLDDALIAVENGADIIGFIFAESPRKIDFYKAKEISLKLPDKILKVGVVVDKDINLLKTGVKEGWLDVIQYHGDFDNDFCQSFQTCWYKALRIKDENDLKLNYYSPIVLFDSFSKNAYGGTGKVINKKLLDYAKNNNIDIYLAGGINPENVREIIDKYKPLLIDISSGVEEYPGKKSKEKIKKLFYEINKKS